jgi:hypothetical protein
MTPRLSSKMGLFSSKKAINNPTVISAVPQDLLYESSTPVRLSEEIESSTGGFSQVSNTQGEISDVGRMRVVVRYTFF